MKIEDINNLPKEFNFESNINPFGILYHAKKTKHGYKVTCGCDNCCWFFSQDKIMRKILNGEYVLV